MGIPLSKKKSGSCNVTADKNRGNNNATLETQKACSPADITKPSCEGNIGSNTETPSSAVGSKTLNKQANQKVSAHKVNTHKNRGNNNATSEVQKACSPADFTKPSCEGNIGSNTETPGSAVGSKTPNQQVNQEVSAHKVNDHKNRGNNNATSETQKACSPADLTKPLCEGNIGNNTETPGSVVGSKTLNQQANLNKSTNSENSNNKEDTSTISTETQQETSKNRQNLRNDRSETLSTTEKTHKSNGCSERKLSFTDNEALSEQNSSGVNTVLENSKYKEETPKVEPVEESLNSGSTETKENPSLTNSVAVEEQGGKDKTEDTSVNKTDKPQNVGDCIIDDNEQKTKESFASDVNEKQITTIPNNSKQKDQQSVADGDEKPVNILQLQSYFEDLSFDGINKESMDFVNLIRKKAEEFTTLVDNYSGTNSSVEYFLLDENLMRLIEELDKVKLRHNRELLKAKVATINYISDLQSKLDAKSITD